MMERRTFLASAMMIPLAVSLGGCDDRWKDYNYKMTVWIGDTPYSTVRHVKVEEGGTIQSSSGRRVDRSVEGEAVIIETPSGPVFALMTPADGQFGNGYFAAYVAEPALIPAINKPQESEAGRAVREYREEQPGFDQLADNATRHNAMLEAEGPRDLPRTIPYPDRKQGPRDVSVWPMFVRFGNINDPASVRQISSDAIGVSRITVEVTKEPVATKIESLLPWLDAYYDKMLDGQRIHNSNNLANTLTPAAFRQIRRD
jgi:hypothetical protein